MNNKIFLSLAAWRDQFVPNTIKSAIEQARYPELVNFGVVFDGYDGDEWMLEGLYDHTPNVRLIKQDGNTSSIYLCEVRGDVMMSLYDDEDYFMQVDCHTKFRKDWDVALRAELEAAKSLYGEKTILTSINSGFGEWSQDFISVPFVCIPSQDILDEFNPNPPVRGEMLMRDKSVLVAERFFNAGMFFCDKNFIKEVPQPKEFSFMLEQPIMTVRTWTAGWNMVAATRNYASNFDYNGFHKPVDDHVRYHRSNDPKWQHLWGEAQDKSLYLYRKIINEGIIDPSYALFDVRTIDEYTEFAGFDPRTLRMVRGVDLYEHPYLEIPEHEWSKMVEEMAEKIGKKNIR